MNIAVVDIECNGLDTETVEIHCIVINLVGVGPMSFDTARGNIGEGIEQLNTLIDRGFVITGHNVVEYDIPILRRYGMKEIPSGQVYDTLVVSRAAYPGNSLYQKDQALLQKKPGLRSELKAGAHSLKAWGLRLGNHKGDYEGGWEEFNEDMLTYCVQDVALNVDVLDLFRQRMPDEAATLECEVARICRDMRLHGVAFDVDKAIEFSAGLVHRREELTKLLKEAFPNWVERTVAFTPKRSQKRRHTRYVDGKLVVRHLMTEGETYWKGKEVEFNPASTDHIAHCLQRKYGWKPKNYTDGGKPQVTAEILRDLRYPEAPLLAEYQEIKKVLGYVSEGTGAWLKLEEKGRLHGKVNPTGTVSGRASHNRPNLGNVPTRSELGHHCRALFRATPDCALVGADASGLQLRILAHYLAKWDGGAFARQCETGDIHEYMRAATGLHCRDHQKTWTYAKLFGAGAAKLGQTALADWRAANERGIFDEPCPKQGAAMALGRQTLDNLGNAIPAYTELEKDLRAAAARGWLATLDGRRIPVGSEHLAIAMLLQGGEAVIMKKAMSLARLYLKAKAAHYVLWVHDEFQVECLPEHADAVGQALVDAMAEAGEHFNLRVKIDGEYKVGNTWAETH